MKEIRNATNGPLRVPLPRGKVLHLPPRQVGQVAPAALEHPPFQKLVEEGKVEVLGEGEHGELRPEKVERGGGAGPGRGGRSAPIHPSGDR
ncbi:MAG TPA: hypothetical protein VF150_06390 [Thermoanaerobaculia bacterium]